jgi:hypothetical protein
MQRKAHPLSDQHGRFLGWMIQCPACGNGHRLSESGWKFNDDLDEPTFSPSLLVRSTDLPAPDPVTDDFARGEDGEYLVDDQGRLLGAKDRICHSFIRDGWIEFLGDSTHELAGQTVELERW